MIFALKKLGQMVAAYAVALAALVLVYLYTPSYLIAYAIRYIPERFISGVGSTPTLELLLRYFLALLVAFTILSVPAVYYRSKIMSSKTVVSSKAPHFYAPSSIGDKTVKSRLGVADSGRRYPTLSLELFSS